MNGVILISNSLLPVIIKFYYVKLFWILLLTVIITTIFITITISKGVRSTIQEYTNDLPELIQRNAIEIISPNAFEKSADVFSVDKTEDSISTNCKNNYLPKIIKNDLLKIEQEIFNMKNKLMGLSKKRENVRIEILQQRENIVILMAPLRSRYISN